uniref:Uncharacterized protein n=1 Tax=Arundo donax TaxID=35708 RepID=A0A0A9BYY8_ARUDO
MPLSKCQYTRLFIRKGNVDVHIEMNTSFSYCLTLVPNRKAAFGYNYNLIIKLLIRIFRHTRQLSSCLSLKISLYLVETHPKPEDKLR